ncbi:MAG: hypothetical protein WDO15_09675 [Bacteroidota bacterium]
MTIIKNTSFYQETTRTEIPLNDPVELTSHKPDIVCAYVTTNSIPRNCYLGGEY